MSSNSFEIKLFYHWLWKLPFFKRDGENCLGFSVFLPERYLCFQIDEAAAADEVLGVFFFFLFFLFQPSHMISRILVLVN